MWVGGGVEKSRLKLTSAEVEVEAELCNSESFSTLKNGVACKNKMQDHVTVAPLEKYVWWYNFQTLEKMRHLIKLHWENMSTVQSCRRNMKKEKYTNTENTTAVCENLLMGYFNHKKVLAYCCLLFWYCLHVWCHLYIWGHLHFWGHPHFRVILIFNVLLISRLIFIFGVIFIWGLTWLAATPKQWDISAIRGSLAS